MTHKTLSFLLAVLMSMVALSFTLVSCGDDDKELTLGGGSYSGSKTIVGTWWWTWGDDYYEQITFNKNGTYTWGTGVKENGKWDFDIDDSGTYVYDEEDGILYLYYDGERETWDITIIGNRMILDDDFEFIRQ